ncbi:MAG: hypothetical protein WAL37_04325 [Xanthobacteraceae bacterium]
MAKDSATLIADKEIVKLEGLGAPTGQNSREMRPMIGRTIWRTLPNPNFTSGAEQGPY